MRRKIPSTLALAAFESAARHRSFTQAASELSVTQSAVCRQVAGLEAFLGVKLFRRTKRGVLLTEAGLGYSRSVRTRLDEVERDTLALMARGGSGGALELGVVPTFATRWLLPRLARFQQAHPGITVHLHARTRPFLFDDTGLDAAIHAGAAPWPGTERLLLMDEQLVAVASLVLVGTRRAFTPAAVARLPLLQASTRPYAWRQWFEVHKLHVDNDLAGARMELFSMLTEAALRSLGVALVPRLLVEDELRAGTLLAASGGELPSGLSYHLVYPEHQADDPVLAVFRDWLDGEAAAYRANAGASASALRAARSTP